MTKTLQELKDRRACERFRYQAPCTYTVEDSDTFHNASIENYCMDGLCLITESPAEPGTDICLRLVNRCSDSAIHYNANVKWCIKIPREKPSYHVGLEYTGKHTRQIFGFKSRKLYNHNTDEK